MDIIMKKLICLTAVCAMLTSIAAPVSATVGGSYDIEESRFTVSGNSDSGFVTMIVTPYGTDTESVDADKINSDGNILYKVAKTVNGEYSDSFLMPDTLAPGRYTVSIFEAGSVSRLDLIKSAAGAESVLLSLNGMSADGIRSAVNTNKQILGLESDFFDETHKAVSVAVENKLKNLSADEVMAMYATYEGVERIKNKSITVAEYFERYSLYVGKDITEAYKLLDKSAVSAAGDVFCSVSAENKSNTEFFDEVFLISKVKSSENYKALQSTVITYFEENDVDTDDYDTLSKSKKEDVFISLRQEIDKVTDYETLLDKFNSCVSEVAKKSENKSSGSSGGGGGGSSETTMNSLPSSKDFNTQNSTPAPTVTTTETGFSDISGHWASENIIALSQQGIVSGDGDGTFRPQDSVTRAEFVTMISKAMKLSPGSGSQFNDVTANDWFYAYVYGAANARIVNGVSDTNFAPGNSITRQDAAVMIFRASGTENNGNVNSYSDNAMIADYAQEAVAALSAAGIVEGNEGKFNPSNMITRAEAATLIYRMLTTPINETAQLSSYDDYAKAQTLVESLAGESFFETTDAGDGVSRAEFIEMLVKVLQKPVITEGDHVFSDVEKDSDAGKYIYAALNYGWIDAQASFGPDENVTLNEAVKYIVCAADAKKLAELRGGYPSGYYSVADEAEFLENIKTTDKFTKETAFVLMYNMLNAGVVELKINGHDSYSFVQKDELYMTRLYDAYVEEGLIRATSFNSFDYTVSVKEDNFITVGDTKIMYDDVSDDILGYNAEVYYIDNEGENRAVLVNLTDNTTITIGVRDASLEGRTVTYAADGRNKKFKISSECFYVYNGRTEKGFSDELFGNSDTTMTFVDNDEDGIYDIAYANVYEYVVVNNVDREGKFISDVNDSSVLIDLNKVVRDGSIINALGEERTLYNIGKDTVLEVRRSRDEQLADIKITESTLSGVISSVRYDDNTAVINGQEYKLTDYFAKWYKDEARLGVELAMTLSSDGMIICIGDGSEAELYAYFMKAIVYEDTTSGAKLLTENNSIERYNFADKVILDGDKTNSSESSFHTFIESTENQLVRFRLDSNGKISTLDTYKLYDGVSDLSSYSGNDCLTKFTFAKSTMRFRSNPLTFSPYFNVSKAVIFKIPTGDVEDEYYETGSHSLFVNANDYTVEAYDIDKYGNAGAVVMSYDVNNQLFTSSDVSYVIEDVTEGVHEDEIVDIVTCWSNGKYYTYYIENSIAVNKGSGDRLRPGDIVRFKLRDDRIIAACVDYYLDGNEVCANTDYSSANFNKSDYQLGFVDGVAKEASERFVMLTNVKSSATTYDTSFSALKNYSINTSYIVRYDREEETIRPVSADEIKTYPVYGTDADYLVLRQNYDNTQLVVLYN